MEGNLRRFVTDFANYKIDQYSHIMKTNKNEDVIRDCVDKMTKVGHAHFYCGEGLITAEEAIKVMVNL